MGRHGDETGYPGTNFIFESKPLYSLNRIPAFFPDGTSNTIFFTEKLALCGAMYGNMWGDDGALFYFFDQGMYSPPKQNIPPWFTSTPFFFSANADNWTPLIGLIYH